MARVAVVEDEAQVRETLATTLRERGYEVVAFQDFSTAYDALSRLAPDLLIADVNLPDGNGLELVARLRTLHAESFPIIVLSGLNSETDFMRGFAAGASDYLSKPFTRDELLARCAVHLGRSTDEGTTALQHDLPREGDLAFRRFEVRSILGRGSYGTVYEAHDTQRGEEVALKVLAALPSSQPEARLRFLRETYALSSVRHENVVRVVDFGAAQGRLYYAMSRVHGPTLRERVATGGPGTPDEAVALLRGLLSALDALEQVQLVHRDVTPANVVLRDGRFDAPVLLDFGLAKRSFDRGLTLDDVLLGTPGFVAPEAVLGRPIDARGDLYAAGLVARFAAVGREPFPELRGMALLNHMARTPVPLPGDLPAPLRDLLARLTALDPDARPASARAALDLLGATV
ncbi:MAG: response regulator [Planctomycetes bacterium]|nr:response regulator [Planctomycetota bacterium]